MADVFINSCRCRNKGNKQLESQDLRFEANSSVIRRSLKYFQLNGFLPSCGRTLEP